MEQITTEEQLRNELEISDFKDITQDNIIPLASNVSRTDRNVLESTFSQIGNFKEIASSALKHCCSITKDLIKADRNNESMLYEQIKNEQNCCFELLKSDQLTFDEKLEILKHLNNIREWISVFDKESKKHKRKTQFMTGAIIGALIATIIYRLSNLLQSSIQKNNSNNVSDEDNE